MNLLIVSGEGCVYSVLYDAHNTRGAIIAEIYFFNFPNVPYAVHKIDILFKWPQCVRCFFHVISLRLGDKKENRLVKTFKCNIIFIKINSIIMQKLISLSCCAPKVLHFQIKCTHDKFSCISNINAVIRYCIICSRRFKIISRYPGVDTWNNNNNNNNYNNRNKNSNYCLPSFYVRDKNARISHWLVSDLCVCLCVFHSASVTAFCSGKSCVIRGFVC